MFEQCTKIVKEAFETKNNKPLSEPNKQLLVQYYSKFSKALKQINKLQKSLNLRKELKIDNIAQYAFKMQTLPIVKPFWYESKLVDMSKTRGLKCERPRFLCLNQNINPSAYKYKRFESDKQVVMRIILQEGADLIYTTDKMVFPTIQSNGQTVGVRKRYNPNMELTFDKKGTLRMIAVKQGKINSDCVSIELVPKKGNFSNDNGGQYNIARKIDINLQESNPQQSPPYFDVRAMMITDNQDMYSEEINQYSDQ